MSESANNALALVSSLQASFVKGLEKLSAPSAFEITTWLRDAGIHGGGSRFSIPEDAESEIFNRASVNVSQIHYNDLPEKKLGSATALSTIIHPRNPHAPSVHIHISWTEMKSGAGYWRMMADLNPSIPNEQHTALFQNSLREAASDYYDAASAQGDRYFYIPALGRHRGATHFYLEGHHTADAAADAALAQEFGNAAINQYLKLLESALRENSEVSADAQRLRLDYHTLYFFQVLTLDRGTTSGLLVHNQNDVGIMGSLPSHVDKALLSSWREKLPAPQEQLLDSLIACLSHQDGDICPVTKVEKVKLAQAVRDHYKKCPEALSLQASGNILPPTVENHK